jgi:GTP-binding protein
MANVATVVIVGRTNVGKSTLFNRMSSQAKSITLDQEGVTRDVIKDRIEWNNRYFELVDTGGITVKRSSDPIMEQVRQKALAMIEQATLILFVCDGSVGLTAEDRELARLVRKSGNPVLLIINKSDRKDVQAHLEEFDELGFKQTFSISAQHGKGMADLLEAVTEQLPLAVAGNEPERVCKVVLLGKPNVGKSSLMNLLLNQERSIVHDAPGTTREAISERISFYKAVIQVTDTAGVRRKRTIDDTLETLMVKSSLRAVEDADIVMLLVDSSQGAWSDQEVKLAFYAFEQKKAVIILFNKNDLMEDDTFKQLEHSVEEHAQLADKLPHLYISCKTGKNVGKILPLVQTVWERYSQEFSDDKVTMLLKDAFVHKPHYHKQNQLILYKVKCLKTAPPTFVLFVNEPDWFGKSQLAFLEGVMRKNYSLEGVPLAFIVRKRG